MLTAEGTPVTLHLSINRIERRLSDLRRDGSSERSQAVGKEMTNNECTGASQNLASRGVRSADLLTFRERADTSRKRIKEGNP